MHETTMPTFIQALKDPRQHQSNEGFTLVEVLIAGAIMAMVLAGVSRLNISALASSATQAQRERIEAAINNNIQMLQKEDSYLRLDALATEAARKAACDAPAETLAAVLGDKVAPPEAEGIDQTISRVFTPLNNGLDLLIVEYSFIAPEHLNKPGALNHTEMRTVELNPNFTARCYLTSA